MVREISPEELKARLDEGRAPTIVDISPPLEFERGHLPGAINVPMNELVSRVDERDWGDEVVVVCPHGQSSIQAARLLGSYEGIDADAVASLAGGYDAWEYELEVDDEAVGSGEPEAPF